jgi:hypothetical protein
MKRRLKELSLSPGSVDFGVRSILHGPNIRRLGFTLSRHDVFVRVECLGELLGAFLPPIALLDEFSQLAGLLPDETLDVREEVWPAFWKFSQECI